MKRPHILASYNNNIFFCKTISITFPSIAEDPTFPMAEQQQKLRAGYGEDYQGQQEYDFQSKLTQESIRVLQRPVSITQGKVILKTTLSHLPMPSAFLRFNSRQLNLVAKQVWRMCKNITMGKNCGGDKSLSVLLGCQALPEISTRRRSSAVRLLANSKMALAASKASLSGRLSLAPSRTWIRLRGFSNISLQHFFFKKSHLLAELCTSETHDI